MEEAVVEAVFSRFGRVVGSGAREDLKFVDIDTTRIFTAEDHEKFEKEALSRGLFLKVINSGEALNKELGRYVQRVWFVAFKSKEELEEWLEKYEERKKRDHRLIGRMLDLFHIEEEIIGPGLPLLHPKGMIIRLELIEYLRGINRKLRAMEVWTPHLAKTVLWKQSGHYDHYKDKMFIWETDGEEWGMKPMNCPMHIHIYKFLPRSYRDLPIRYAEFATVYRKEQSGELHGLARVWSLTQDDHHFIVRKDQIEEEILKILEAIKEVYEKFGLSYKAKLSTRPDDYIGSIEVWEIAEEALEQALRRSGITYEVKPKEGAFYGPKIDFDVKDSLGREWQLATVQLDFFMPERFDMRYVTKDGGYERPVIIHFAIFGSIERFMALLLEHTAGKLPFWLSPIQIALLPLADRHLDYARAIEERLYSLGLRPQILAEGTLQKRIKIAHNQKIPVIVVMGDKEVKNHSVNIRGIGEMPLEEFIKRAVEAYRERRDKL